MLSVESTTTDKLASDSRDSVNTTQSAASIPVPPHIDFYDDAFVQNSVLDALQQRTALLKSKARLTIPREADVFRPRRQLDVPALLETLNGDGPSVKVVALVDSGATGSVIDAEFARANGFKEMPLDRPIPVLNADGTRNRAGDISSYVELAMTVQGHQERIPLAVAKLGTNALFLGHDWLRYHNPEVDWRLGTINFTRCPSTCGTPHEPEDDPFAEEGLEAGDRIFVFNFEAYSQEQMEYAQAMHARAFQTHASKIAEQQAAQRKEQTFTERVPAAYHDYKDVFDKDEFDKLPESRPWDHAIELTKEFRPVDSKVYPLSREEQKQLDVFLEENLRSGRIRPSKSPMASPFFFIKKKDGTLRPVQDYRKLNEMTIKNRYPLPLIQELLDKLKGARYFTKLDVRWGYNNVRIKEGDEWKAAFKTNRGHFEPMVMFFGLTNSPATFQAMMNSLFGDLIASGKVVIYLDDILIFTETIEEHREVVRQVLEVLRQNHLYLKPEKCEFEQTSIEYLGMIVEEGKVRMDPAKVAAIRDWPTPTKKRDLQSFIGFCNFYRRFIEDFSKIARPLHDLTKDVPWRWGEDQQMAFEALKEKISSEPVLAIPRDEGQFRVEADASDYATGAVLSQEQDGKWHPIAFLSKSLNEPERNYEIYDKEMLAIMTALEEWRQYLLGTTEPFEIWTDHQNLTYFREARKLNRRQARWFTELQDYHFVLYHKPGKTMGKPDALSRDSVKNEGKRDNENVILLKPDVFMESLRLTIVDIEGPDTALYKRIKDSKAELDPDVQKGLATGNARWIRTEDGVILDGNRLYVPRDQDLRADILQAHHDTQAAGHPGQEKTYELVSREYTWPGIRRDVRKYVAGCQTCQRVKIDRSGRHAPLHPQEVPSGAFEHVAIDFVGPLPESEGMNMICVFTCILTKYVIYAPCTDKVDSPGLARLFHDHVYRDHGLPRKVISDRGPQFVSKFTKALYQLEGVKGNPSTAYHPQTDGQAERQNQELETFLRIWVTYHMDDWARWLASAQFRYNNLVHSATGTSPFRAVRGRDPYSGYNPQRIVNVPGAADFAEHRHQILEEVQSALREAKKRMKEQYDKHVKGILQYKPGDRVWISAKNITSARPTDKLEHQRYGPFKILKIIGASAYKVDIPKSWKSKRVHDVFNQSYLRPYVAPFFKNQVVDDPPPPEIIEREDGAEIEYDVEKILDSKVTGRKPHTKKLQYLVKWEGYGLEDASWEPVEGLEGARKAIADFHKKNPKKPNTASLRTVSLERG